MTTAPCYGLHDLFDSTELIDHQYAKTICRECPLILACARAAADLNRGTTGRPIGTWAGQLRGPRKVGRPRKDAA